MGGRRPSNCACDRKREDGTCFTINELRTIAAAIRRTRGVALEGRTKGELYEGILDAMSCDGDRCLSQKTDLPHDLRKRLREALVPMAPREWLSNPTAWLSNFDIEAKVREIVRNKRKYLFLGVFPMDAEHKESGSGSDRCVSQALCEYHPAEVRAKYPCFAAVFNTDYHGLPGSHWVALMGYLRRDDPRYGLYYYDSTGRRPMGDIDRLITRLSAELKEADGQEPPYLYNDTQHQNSNTECGMFCISFIDAMVNSRRTFPEMCERMHGDAEMIRRRSVYFEMPSTGGRKSRR